MQAKDQTRGVIQRGPFTRCDVIAEKLQGGTVIPADVKRALRIARDASETSEDRMKIIDALRVPGKDVFPQQWADAVLRNIAKKDNDPGIREAAERTLFFRKRR